MSKKLNEAVKAKYEEQVRMHVCTWAALTRTHVVELAVIPFSQLKVDELNSKVSAQKVRSSSALTAPSQRISHT